MSNVCKIPPEWLAQFRRRAVELGLTQRDLDVRGKLPDGYSSKIMAGQKAVTPRTLQRFLVALDLEIEFRPRP